MESSDAREHILEKAEELGRLISQTAEYAYLKAASREIGDDREATETLNRMRELQDRLLEHVGKGQDPPEELQQEYAELQERVQQSSRYQSLIASQANFDKLMERVHRSIGNGIRKGEESRIIIPS
ncbi:MAG: YlbF family regulator [Gemmatimonadota bacterium]